MAESSHHQTPDPSHPDGQDGGQQPAEQPLDQAQLDAIAGGIDYMIGTGSYCSVHHVVWPCPVMVTLASGETGPCPGPRFKQFPTNV
jgi:hypothetical protein